jgi:4-carboxymuconolactone decarboxylase
MTIDDIRAASPALGHYTEDLLLSDVWKRAQLQARNRSIVTISALIARNQTIEMRHHLSLALTNGVTPGEVSEVIAHLTFYSGMGKCIDGCLDREGGVQGTKHPHGSAAASAGRPA